MSEPIIETHPFPPVLPPAATVMMMGTFPPKDDKRAMQFHYPNFQNDMWRLYGQIFFNDADYFKRRENYRVSTRARHRFLPDRMESHSRAG